MRTARATLLAALTAAVAILLAGCGDTAPAAPASAAGGSTLHDALPAEVRDAGVLRFAGDSHPPYRTVGPDGSVTGVDRDFQEALGRLLGVRTETVVVDSLPAALQGMLAGRYDAFNGPVKATAEREQSFDTVTWMTTRTSYVIPASAPAPVTTADGLCGKRVAVVSASVVEEQLRKLSEFCRRNGKPVATPVGLADTNATLLAAQSGRADAAGMTQAAAIDVTTQRKGEFTSVTQTEEQGATADNLALFVPKEAGLGPVMQQAFEQLFASGEYRRIMDHWGLGEVAVTAPLYNAGTAA